MSIAKGVGALDHIYLAIICKLPTPRGVLLNEDFHELGTSNISKHHQNQKVMKTSTQCGGHRNNKQKTNNYNNVKHNGHDNNNNNNPAIVLPFV